MKHGKTRSDGKNSARGAAAYLLAKCDHLGNERAAVNVLRGDANTFTSICNSSPHLWKYTSAVISFAQQDSPSQEQIKEVLNEFEAHAFAGLEPNQYNMFAVQHDDDDGSKHIHILVPRLELTTGKSLNIAPPGHEKYFNNVRDYLNYKYNFERPDSILNSITTQPPKMARKLIRQAEKNLSKTELKNLRKSDFCSAVDSYMTDMIRCSKIKNRHDIIEILSKFDEISSIKASKNYLLINLADGKKHRLKGDYYNEKFEIESYRTNIKRADELRASRGELKKLSEEAYKLTHIYREKRAKFNRKNFKSRQLDSKPETTLSLQANDRGYNQETRIATEHKRSSPGNIEQYSEIANKDRALGNRSEQHKQSVEDSARTSTADFSTNDSKLCESISSKTYSNWTYDIDTGSDAIKFLYDLSEQYKYKNTVSAKERYTEQCSDFTRSRSSSTSTGPTSKLQINENIAHERDTDTHLKRDAYTSTETGKNEERARPNDEFYRGLSKARQRAKETDRQSFAVEHAIKRGIVKNTTAEFISSSIRSLSVKYSNSIIDSIAQFFNREASQTSDRKRTTSNSSELEDVIRSRLTKQQSAVDRLKSRTDRTRSSIITASHSISSLLSNRNRQPKLVFTRTFQSCFNVKKIASTQELLKKADEAFLSARAAFNDNLLITTTYSDQDVHKLIIDYVNSTKKLVDKISENYEVKNKDYIESIEKFSQTLKQHQDWLINTYHNLDQNNGFTLAIKRYSSFSAEFENYSHYCVENYSPQRDLKKEPQTIYEPQRQKDKENDLYTSSIPGPF
ncbi:relaxase/mobilization nuclease domain-containing protein [Acinetobacter nectaris]|uniref:relaxase/mobilization nuclease domain-containing protein n=1 Tax=Acinetobacter nectaris TaxID=1219382 RepID=UPI001F362E88|nr:relaxase/mobilization nuclease domain-containing protein [Acinetobacter nectaris]MCF9028537.1 hypothetical protein [Acinetobacter nectaris]